MEDELNDDLMMEGDEPMGDDLEGDMPPKPKNPEMESDVDEDEEEEAAEGDDAEAM